jgi:hypothetical protein
VTALDPDRLDESQLDDLRRELASMSDAALARTYETYRMACGLRKDGVPRPATTAFLAGLGGVPPPVGVEPVNMMRLMNGFFKELGEHWAALCLHVAHYNFCASTARSALRQRCRRASRIACGISRNCSLKRPIDSAS